MGEESDDDDDDDGDEGKKWGSAADELSIACEPSLRVWWPKRRTTSTRHPGTATSFISVPSSVTIHAPLLIRGQSYNIMTSTHFGKNILSTTVSAVAIDSVVAIGLYLLSKPNSEISSLMWFDLSLNVDAPSPDTHRTWLAIPQTSIATQLTLHSLDIVGQLVTVEWTLHP
ncbi:hypothetical protein M011DRAFT_457601 [Sporormia fimetaria CBS 119925]|uniref:Uncharacterized protein n=1 Tax=Sporormia fimetaria CBS 119925 TaxID=1340428 RepID=A0A6A6VC93_9PLEO|nr:hypothetical protein M011DRAFT_457601 [Sporormia fimetaria CBS 119925]